MMKNKVHQFRSVLIIILTNLLISSSIFAQSTEKMSYQAVIRNSSDALLTNTQVGMKISILQGSETGTVVYTETQTPTTNANGLTSIEIGGGKVEAGVFQNIDWSVSPCFIKIETDLTGGTNYTITGTNQLLSVPYALHAKTAEAISGSSPGLIGANIGDMQYWNGTEWVVLSAGRAGQFLYFNSSNLPVWQSVASPSRLYPPVVEALPASNMESFAAQLNGIVNAKGLRSDIVFEWGITPDYGQIASAIPDIVTGSGNRAISTSLSGLESNTTYHYRIKATNAVDITYSENMSFNISLPQLTTNIITDNLGFSATGGGNITYDGGSPFTARGICWSTNQTPTISDNKTEDSTGIGAFTSTLTGLTLGTTYYVRAYATNSVATVYGNEITFTTIALPTLTTSIAYDIRGNSAKAGGIVTNGGSIITEQGLCWSTTVNPTIANSITTSFTDVLTELSPNTTYYVRAYATNNAGTGYGPDISFNSGKLIGSTFGGGLVFYNDGEGNGLVCAETDQSTRALWGCSGTSIGGTSTNLNTGAANTNAIVAGCGAEGIAARLCYDLNLNSYSDWFLPSKDELSLMRTNLHTQGLGGFKDGFYWSSSEYNHNYAWLYALQSGNTINYYKYLPYSVRAVRAF